MFTHLCRPILIGLGVAALCAVAALPAAAWRADRSAQGKQVVANLAKRDFKAVVKTFDDRMKQALPADKLAQVWDGVIQQAGAFKKQVGTRSEKANEGGQSFDVVLVTCQFAQASLDVKVVYNGAGQVAGLFIVPS